MAAVTPRWHNSLASIYCKVTKRGRSHTSLAYISAEPARAFMQHSCSDCARVEHKSSWPGAGSSRIRLGPSAEWSETHTVDGEDYVTMASAADSAGIPVTTV